MLEKIYEILSEQLDVPVEEINENSNIQENLGADSLDIMEIVSEIEDSFDIEVDDEEVEQLTTPKKIVEYINRKKA